MNTPKSVYLLIWPTLIVKNQNVPLGLPDFSFSFPWNHFRAGSRIFTVLCEPVYINPAFTGTSELPRMVMNYRNQWPNQAQPTKPIRFPTMFFQRNQTQGLGSRCTATMNLTTGSTPVRLPFSIHTKFKWRNKAS